jgi:hypothetical protein
LLTDAGQSQWPGDLTNSDFLSGVNWRRGPDPAILINSTLQAAKLIVPHGVSDPVFSVNDTIAWYNEVQSRAHGKAARFVRVLPIPGMAHCGGGPATDEFNAFEGLVDWVEQGKAPDRIIATAGPGSAWPGRTRPLCAYPAIAHYKGTGSIEDAENFSCH